ncbi:uncharacterized protein DNG_05940 [Cephalotrichum gorgonifer]|uniref:Uncharacterized protein n=1 Tax=Cephalotrichum gorgonifer TaxID=2041049 RepID=A0AAE8N0S5_9PEZI|nr:uncharacterized protein DNG_05940 [Cephalotrichum gorgonifer]
MQLRNLASFILLAFPSLVLSDLVLSWDDVPSHCSSVCDPVVTLTNICNVNSTRVNGTTEILLEKQCICTNRSFDVGNRTALCASCMDQNSLDQGDKEDMSSIMSACNFSSTSWTSNQTTATTANVTATRPTASSQLTTSISTGVGQPTATGAPGAAGKVDLSGVGLIGALAAGIMLGL